MGTEQRGSRDEESLQQQVESLVAREEIRRVLYDYARYVDRADVDGMKSIYHDDATDIHWGTYIGNAHGLADYLGQELPKLRSQIHEITNPIIDLAGDRALVESRFTARVRTGFDGAPAGCWVESVAHGRYLDIFERRNGVWKIFHRRLVIDGGRAALITDLGEYAEGSLGQFGASDPMYWGFELPKHAPEPLAPTPDRFSRLREFGRRALAESGS